MIVDGKNIARELLDEVAVEIAEITRAREQPKLTVFTCAPNFATKKFLGIKERTAKRVGVLLEVCELDPESTTEDIVEHIQNAAATTDGIIVQLPFPQHVDVEAVLGAIPATHDIDVIGGEAERLFAQNESPVLPPVVGAIAEIVKRHEVSLHDTHALVVGRGRLVGAPAATWLSAQGAHVDVLDKKTTNLSEHVREADVLVLGAGQSRMITKEMLKDGVMLFDAGTSEDAGELVGDADPACAEKAALFTPVPGGIGPITIAIIFKNLLTLLVARSEGGD